eukprot:Skav232143  [mRNA]  locus=scaffold1744:251683:258484:- [translate_table: standard]
MMPLKFALLLLVRSVLSEVATCNAADFCDDGLAHDFAAAVGKDGPEESLELLQVKRAEELTNHPNWRKIYKKCERIRRKWNKGKKVNKQTQRWYRNHCQDEETPETSGNMNGGGGKWPESGNVDRSDGKTPDSDKVEAGGQKPDSEKMNGGGNLMPDLSKIDWSKFDWSKFDWGKVDWSKLGGGGTTPASGKPTGSGSQMPDLSKMDWSKMDWSKFDWSKIDWSKIDWSKMGFGGVAALLEETKWRHSQLLKLETPSCSSFSAGFFWSYSSYGPHAMMTLKFALLLLVRPLLSDVATCNAADFCDDGLAHDFAAAVGKDGPEESLELLQVKRAEFGRPPPKKAARHKPRRPRKRHRRPNRRRPRRSPRRRVVKRSNRRGRRPNQRPRGNIGWGGNMPGGNMPDLSKMDWSKMDWSKMGFGGGKMPGGKMPDLSKMDWSKMDWSKIDWSKMGFGGGKMQSSGKLDKGSGNMPDLSKMDWSKMDWSKIDWSKIDWSKMGFGGA